MLYAVAGRCKVVRQRRRTAGAFGAVVVRGTDPRTPPPCPTRSPPVHALLTMAAKPYSFDQTDSELHILLPLEAAYKAKDVVFTLSPNSLTLGIKGQARACLRRVAQRVLSALRCAVLLAAAGHRRSAVGDGEARRLSLGGGHSRRPARGGGHACKSDSVNLGFSAEV